MFGNWADGQIFKLHIWGQRKLPALSPGFLSHIIIIHSPAANVLTLDNLVLTLTRIRQRIVDQDQGQKTLTNIGNDFIRAFAYYKLVVA
jgi:hypothetical protein